MSDELESENAVSPASDSRKAQVVDVYDGERFIQSVPVISGKFELSVAGLTEGAHLFTARIGDVASTAWAVVVSTLKVDPPIMQLHGWFVHAPWELTGNDAPGNTQACRPSGGKPPYSYASDHPETATVTSTGKVQGVRNGSATITVRDDANNSVSFPVDVRNVRRLIESNGPYRGDAAVNWIRNNGGELTWSTVGPLIASMEAVYRKPFPMGNVHRWLCQSPNVPTNYTFFNWSSQEIFNAAPDSPGILGAWCFSRNGTYRELSPEMPARKYVIIKPVVQIIDCPLDPEDLDLDLDVNLYSTPGP